MCSELFKKQNEYAVEYNEYISENTNALEIYNNNYNLVGKLTVNPSFTNVQTVLEKYRELLGGYLKILKFKINYSK